MTEDKMKNEQLIKAAPEMLEALLKLQTIYNDFSRDKFSIPEIRKIIDEAIQKAVKND